VLTPELSAELQKYFPNAEIIFIPPRFYHESISKCEANTLKIVVPGTAEKRRRDYEFIFSFSVNYLSKIDLNLPVELVLLGKASPAMIREIRQWMGFIPVNVLKIIYYEVEVSPNEYANQMREAKITWNPIRIQTKGSRGQAEQYGVTKSAGFAADLIQFPMPALVPAGFNIPFYFKQCMIYYDGEDDLLQKMIWLLQNDLSNLIQKIEKDISVLIPSKFEKDFKTLMEIE
jgi:hypothetical protein